MNCPVDNIVSVSSSLKISDEAGYGINMRVAKAFTSISKGFAAVEHFSMVTNMDCMSKHLYNKCSQRVLKLGKMSGIESLSQARDRVRQHCLSEHKELKVDSVLDLAVSFDGSWHKRGFTSNYGVGSVIHVDTGIFM